ncbi:hypothetical protein [Celerinatantimonas diazotrophica]|uniref:Uncharacterized protein n=1 Tax=Celerinatantimonas diazotrophica TaxID=412034 RepID=A0A4R1KF35_9GAMM|nr:hypothetical protein [Celerinatantimonas diazotrophica]TCK62730.1 hypothetical protein EV690_0396 [Celerinatantimonas diazotrophica]CAG9298360.1 hypothetical protein CEDIAZO_03560 [Celerinatantimonas diazotrophica]
MDKQTNRTIQLSIISTCPPRQMSLLIDTWQTIRQTGIESELIWLAEHNNVPEQSYPDLRIVNLNKRSDRNGCWQAGLHMARSSKRLLISHFTPALSQRTCSGIARVLKHPQAPSSRLSYLRQRLASLAVLHGQYQLTMSLLPMCLIDYDSLLKARRDLPQHWYQYFKGYHLSSV